MNEELKQAVESYAKSVSRTTEAILPNRLRESIDAYNDGVHNGVLMGAQFLFSLLSNPSERPNIKDYLGDSAGLNDVHEQIIAAPRIYAYMQALDAYIDGLFAVPVKSAKPSENAKLLQPFSCCQENEEKPAVSQTSDWETKRLADAVQSCFDHNRANPEQAARTYEALEKALANLETNE